jgi:hypothetical protein
MLTGGGQRGYQTLRRTFGGVLLLGLEFLVAADLIRTVAVAPTLQNVAGLGLVVLIRTFLSFSLQVETDGVVPWRRALTTTGAGTMARGPARPGRGGGRSRRPGLTALVPGKPPVWGITSSHRSAARTAGWTSPISTSSGAGPGPS